MERCLVQYLSDGTEPQHGARGRPFINNQQLLWSAVSSSICHRRVGRRMKMVWEQRHQLQQRQGQRMKDKATMLSWSLLVGLEGHVMVLHVIRASMMHTKSLLYFPDVWLKLFQTSWTSLPCWIQKGQQWEPHPSNPIMMPRITLPTWHAASSSDMILETKTNADQETHNDDGQPSQSTSKNRIDKKIAWNSKATEDKYFARITRTTWRITTINPILWSFVFL